MDALYLIKIGEILLKLGNRREFEDRLHSHLHRRLTSAEIPNKVEMYPGRYFVTLPEERSADAERIFSRTPGINGYARAHQDQKRSTPSWRGRGSRPRPPSLGKRSFKAESRRSDKSFHRFLRAFGPDRRGSPRALPETRGRSAYARVHY